ncbi:MAG TPA: alpha/beta hydrolase [Gammaproteobacteria bacterium]|nr:alpha/beta hydrolase [Gammaproteobacteria bacterium]
MIRSKLLPVGLMSVAASGVWSGAAAAPTVQADIQYATTPTGEPLRLDLYTPQSGSGAPLVVWVHGGAWENGNKSAMPLAPVIERGFAVASLDFSPASKAPFPGQVHEIKAAIRFLRAQAKHYGYDASRIAIAGASSGAHLADVVGTSNGVRELEGTLGDHDSESSAVHAIVSYFAATNLTTILAQSTPFGLGVREPALKRLLGAAPKDAEQLARLASPVFQVDRSDPPLLLLHGDQDPQMPINQSHELEGAYEKLGLDAKLIVVHGAAHGGDAFYSPENVQRVVEFLSAQLDR